MESYQVFLNMMLSSLALWPWDKWSDDAEWDEANL